MSINFGDNFQQLSKYQRGKIGGYLDRSKKPKIYKNYPNSKTFSLPNGNQMQTLSFDQAVKNRRSVRNYKQKTLTIQQVSYLLWISTGIQRKQQGYEFRNAPSAGALYPIETYLHANNVENLQTGLYHYNIKNHNLEQISTLNQSVEITKACLGQDMPTKAPITLIWTAIFQRSKWKYKQRAYRYIYIDVGHIAQNLALCVSAIGLGSCQIGAFYDNEINKILQIDGKIESTIYLSTVGFPKITNH